MEGRFSCKVLALLAANRINHLIFGVETSSYQRMSQRRQIREAVLQSLYAFNVGGNTIEDVLNLTLKPMLVEYEAEFARFAESLFIRTARKTGSFDEMLQEQVDNWDIDRLAVIDRMILNMAFIEFLEFEEIPVKVTINEAIEVAKKYSTDHSGKFINGILDAVLAKWKIEGRISKSGRGLIDQTLSKN